MSLLKKWISAFLLVAFMVTNYSTLALATEVPSSDVNAEIIEAVEHASMQLLITSLFLLIANTHSGDDALMGHTRSHPEHDG